MSETTPTVGRPNTDFDNMTTDELIDAVSDKVNELNDTINELNARMDKSNERVTGLK